VSVATSESGTRQRILAAARERLLAEGFAALSTRKIADAAAVPLSQVHYHLGTKQEMILNLLRAENDRLLTRQAAMFAQDLSLADRWSIACDYLDDDLESGFVRILHEMTAAGWSSPAVGAEVRQMLNGWVAVLADVVRRAADDGLELGGLGPQELAALVSAAFIGAESLILTGVEDEGVPLRSALRSVGRLISRLEEAESA
jgi:AcrR family transcriptional regulator